MSELTTNYRDLSGDLGRKTVDKAGISKASRTIVLPRIFRIFGEVADIQIVHSFVGDRVGIYLKNRETGESKRLAVLDQKDVKGYYGNKLKRGRKSGFVAKHDTKRAAKKEEIEDIFDALSNERVLNFSTD